MLTHALPLIFARQQPQRVLNLRLFLLQHVVRALEISFCLRHRLIQAKDAVR